MERQRPDQKGTSEQHAARRRLHQLFEGTPLPTDDLLVNLPLYMRSSVVAKLLHVDELYREIVERPGIIMEFGVWYGGNLALFESLRAVHEPYNYTRKIVGFDTFAGYPAPAPEDGKTAAEAGGYGVPEGYENHLSEVLDYHESENPMAHIPKYELAVGDAEAQLESYLERHPETVVALAYFDMQLYEPTKRCLELLRPHLAKGSVIALDELNSPDYPGETVAYREAVGLSAYPLRRARFLPDRAYAIVE